MRSRGGGGRRRSRPAARVDQTSRPVSRLKQRRLEIFDRYKNESSVSRGTSMIRAAAVLGDKPRGYFNCAKGRGILLAYGYTGPEEDFLPLAEQLYRYCDRNDLQFNLFARSACPRSAARLSRRRPSAVMQRIVDLQNFTLDGGPKRRLRYQISKFQNAGVCRTEEYRCGSDPAKATSIAAIIDQWCAGRTMVNPLIHVVKDEILARHARP